ncbi:MAG: hypothetical protein ABI863_11190 [Ginsengibacter sp.]
MHLDTTILLRVLPALGILLLAEVIYMIKEHRHDNKDMLSGICLTLGHLPVSVVTKVAVIYFYTLIYQYRFFTIPFNCWWAWAICFFAMIFLITGFTAAATR